MLDTNIILIGPGGTGKSTLAALVAETLDVSSLDLDRIRWDYYAEIGYEREKGEQIRREGGMPALAAYWKPFEVYSIERMMQDYPTGYVIALGAGQSVYDDPAFFERAQKALAHCSVILLLPSPDIEESLLILTQRIRVLEPEMPDSFFEMIDTMNRMFITHPANARLANRTIYTKDKTPAQTCAEILAHIRPSI